MVEEEFASTTLRAVPAGRAWGKWVAACGVAQEGAVKNDTVIVEVGVER